MTSRDKVGMSLDDIIRLNRRKNDRANGSVTSRGTQQRRGGRGGSNTRGRGGMNVRGRGGRIIRGRGGGINRGRGGGINKGRGGGINIGRGGGINKGRGGGINRGSRGTINRGFRGGLGSGRIRSRARSVSRDRGGTPNRGRGGGTPNRVRGGGSPNRGRGGRNQPFRGRRGLQRQGKPFHGNQNITNFFRSDQIVRQQAIQQKLNRARNLKQMMSKNSVSGASDLLTVCIANDLATKRRRSRSSSVPRFGSSNRGSFIRRSNSNSYLNRQSLDRLDVCTDNSSVVVSPEGSVVTTISRQSRASSVGHNRNRRSSSVGREMVNPNRGQMAMDQYLPATPWQSRSGLNVQLQKEIAAIQGKTYLPSAGSTGFANGSSIAVSLSEFRPVPTLTGTTLNERFS